MEETEEGPRPEKQNRVKQFFDFSVKGGGEVAREKRGKKDQK